MKKNGTMEVIRAGYEAMVRAVDFSTNVMNSSPTRINQFLVGSYGPGYMLYTVVISLK